MFIFPLIKIIKYRNLRYSIQNVYAGRILSIDISKTLQENKTCHCFGLGFFNRIHAFIFALECIDGFYGSECNMTCEHCNKTFPGCLQINGSCLYGCENIHWEGDKCDG